MSAMERVFAPAWAGGWSTTRWMYALVGLWMHFPRVMGISDAYAAHDFMWVRPPLNVPNWWILTDISATILWALSILGLMGLLKGGRFARPGLILWLVTSTIFLSHEGLNYKAYDRVHEWIGFCLLFGPISESNLGNKARSPLGRWLLLIFFCGLYACTGFSKALVEPSWWTGEKLALDLVDLNFGNRPLGLWLSGQPTLLKVSSWITLAFECSFAFLIWWRRSNPIVLVMGVLFHIGVLATMNVGPFSYVTLCAYPVLLHPEVARVWWNRWTDRRKRNAG